MSLSGRSILVVDLSSNFGRTTVDALVSLDVRVMVGIGKEDEELHILAEEYANDGKVRFMKLHGRARGDYIHPGDYLNFFARASGLFGAVPKTLVVHCDTGNSLPREEFEVLEDLGDYLDFAFGMGEIRHDDEPDTEDA
ncbi:MAG: hypothetical protein MMC23_002473 [Stictis urceolatum]|nr:hypothetical protein [Stictis urceolata]